MQKYACAFLGNVLFMDRAALSCSTINGLFANNFYFGSILKYLFHRQIFVFDLML